MMRFLLSRKKEVTVSRCISSLDGERRGVALRSAEEWTPEWAAQATRERAQKERSTSMVDAIGFFCFFQKGNRCASE